MTNRREIDGVDRDICLLLQQDGSKSCAEVASQLGVNPATVRRRLNRLIKLGAIRFTAVPNHDVLGFRTSALVGLDVSTTAVLRLTETLTNCPEVTFLARVAGTHALLVWVVLETSQALGAFLDKLGSMEGVIRTETMLVLEIAKRTGGRFK